MKLFEYFKKLFKHKAKTNNSISLRDDEKICDANIEIQELMSVIGATGPTEFRSYISDYDSLSKFIEITYKNKYQNICIRKGIPDYNLVPLAYRDCLKELVNLIKVQPLEI